MWDFFFEAFGRGFDSRHLLLIFLKIFDIFIIFYIYIFCNFFFFKNNIYFYKKFFKFKIKDIFNLKSLIYKNLKDDYLIFLTYKIFKIKYFKKF